MAKLTAINNGNIKKISQLESELKDLNEKKSIDNENFAQFERKIKSETDNLEKEIELRKNEVEINKENTRKLEEEYQVIFVTQFFFHHIIL